MKHDRHNDRYTTRYSRRGMLQAGALGLLGLSLPQLLRAETASGGAGKRARSCIVLFLEGGPSHIDLWDMKPQAAAEVRGEFRPISTTVPSVPVCEHLPRLAQQMHRLALVRSVHHKIVDHNAGAYYALTGYPPMDGGQLIINDRPGNFPPYGAVLGRLRPLERKLPAFVQLPDIMSNNGYDLPGQRAGFLGISYDPFVAGDPSAPDYQLPGLTPLKGVSPDRLQRRRSLLDGLNRTFDELGERGAVDRLETHQRRAFELLSASAAREAFDLSRESAATKERYGLPDRVDRSVEARKFGGLPHLGQCLLMARRLIEAGVRLVMVGSGRRFDQAWDTHRDHFPLLKKSLLPYLDQGLSALLEDMAARGLLDETLVVIMGEFGRTPKLGQITSGAGADAGGRDHWPHCYTVLFAGGGIQGSALHGASDRMAAYPASDPVTPEDIAATIYHALGIAPDQRIADPLNRPHFVSLGKPILPLFGS